MNDKCVVLNAKKMNFDGKLDFSMLSSDVTVYDDTTKEQLSERIQGADIIVTKEMPVSGEMIQHFPESVKLILRQHERRGLQSVIFRHTAQNV